MRLCVSNRLNIEAIHNITLDVEEEQDKVVKHKLRKRNKIRVSI